MKIQFRGFRRPDEKVGVRNHVAIVSTVFCASTVVRRIAEATGTAAIIHERGCLELGPDREHTERVLRGVVGHPNVGAVLVVGLGCEQVVPELLVQAAVGKPAQYLRIRERGGTEVAVEQGIDMARELLVQASKAERRPASLADLMVATQCGSSDTGSGVASNPAVGVLADMLIDRGGTVLLGETGSLYGAAGVMVERCATPEIGRRLMEITNVIEDYYARMDKSLKEANPTLGNIAGGLTTLVEKSLGGVRKGGTAQVQGVVNPAQSPPTESKGLWVMDTSMGLGTHVTTDMVAGGAQLLVYTTGGGNPVGSVIAPVIKVTATPSTAALMSENVDFDASPVLLGEETVDACGIRLFEEFLAVANGKPTKAEKLGNTLFAIGQVALA